MPRRTPAVPGESFARWVVALSGSAVVGACMAFSFGNVLALGRHLDAPAYIAWCVAPAVDLTVVGLIVGIRHLSIHGATDEELKLPRRMLKAAGLTMWALNIAYPLFVQRNFGAVAYDSVPPLLLLGWSEVGPWFLRRFRTLTAPTNTNRPRTAAASEADTVRGRDANDTANTTAPVRAHRARRTSAATANGHRANGSDADAREHARVLWEQSVREGAPMSGAALGRATGRSARWGQKLLADFQAEPPASTNGAPPPDAAEVSA